MLMLCDGKSRWTTARCFSENQLVYWIRGLQPDKMLEAVSVICVCFKCKAKWRLESPVASSGISQLPSSGDISQLPDDGQKNRNDTQWKLVVHPANSPLCLNLLRIHNVSSFKQMVRWWCPPRIMLYHVYRCFVAHPWSRLPTVMHFGPWISDVEATRTSPIGLSRGNGPTRYIAQMTLAWGCSGCGCTVDTVGMNDCS